MRPLGRAASDDPSVSCGCAKRNARSVPHDAASPHTPAGYVAEDDATADATKQPKIIATAIEHGEVSLSSPRHGGRAARALFPEVRYIYTIIPPPAARAAGATHPRTRDHANTL